MEARKDKEKYLDKLTEDEKALDKVIGRIIVTNLLQFNKSFNMSIAYVIILLYCKCINKQNALRHK